MKDKYTHSEVWNYFDRKRNKVDILFSALDYMQQYNGRSQTECVALAMNINYEE